MSSYHDYFIKQLNGSYRPVLDSLIDICTPKEIWELNLTDEMKPLLIKKTDYEYLSDNIQNPKLLFIKKEQICDEKLFSEIIKDYDIIVCQSTFSEHVVKENLIITFMNFDDTLSKTINTNVLIKKFLKYDLHKILISMIDNGYKYGYKYPFAFVQ